MFKITKGSAEYELAKVKIPDDYWFKGSFKIRKFRFC